MLPGAKPLGRVKPEGEYGRDLVYAWLPRHQLDSKEIINKYGFSVGPTTTGSVGPRIVSRYSAASVAWPFGNTFTAISSANSQFAYKGWSVKNAGDTDKIMLSVTSSNPAIPYNTVRAYNGGIDRGSSSANPSINTLIDSSPQNKRQGCVVDSLVMSFIGTSAGGVVDTRSVSGYSFSSIDFYSDSAFLLWDYLLIWQRPMPLAEFRRTLLDPFWGMIPA